MSVTDTDQLTELQLALQEDATFSNGLWTPVEVLGYFNQRQYRFLKETGIIAAWAVIPWIPQETTQPLPPDWIATLAVLWQDLTTGIYTPLPPSDTWELDHVAVTGASTSAALPQAYRDGTLETLTLAVGPAPAAPGALELLYVGLSDLLDGLGTYFTIPDEWVPYIKYGVYADMLGKDGRGQDLLRARYAEVRYQEGLALAAALLEGF